MLFIVSWLKKGVIHAAFPKYLVEFYKATHEMAFHHLQIKLADHSPVPQRWRGLTSQSMKMTCNYSGMKFNQSQGCLGQLHQPRCLRGHISDAYLWQTRAPPSPSLRARRNKTSNSNCRIDKDKLNRENSCRGSTFIRFHKICPFLPPGWTSLQVFFDRINILDKCITWPSNCLKASFRGVGPRGPTSLSWIMLSKTS
jgi:hypothetical protein